MKAIHQNKQSRREFLKVSALTTAGLSLAPYLSNGEPQKISGSLMKRDFGKLGFKVTTMGLGGQSSIQWTPENIDPVAIIVKAYQSGINYFDTSNVYGPSQMNYGKAFRQLGLVPENPNYDAAKRGAIFLTSKTMLRFAKGGDDRKDVMGGSNGPKGSKALDDVRRTLSQVFGDGTGTYPKDAYVDMVLIHSLTKMGEVDALYEGYDNTDPNAPTIGALAVLRDVRDGTNRTGLNPKNEKLIRHIGFSGHSDAAAMIELIQRDSQNLLEGMLVAINANDKLNFNMQHNVIPVAAAKNMGIIAMKVFADGAMYTKKAEWSNKPEHVVLQVGSDDVPANELIRYSLTTPGIHTAIIGIGMINDDPSKCQLQYNLAASQVKPNEMSKEDREKIEAIAAKVKEGKTNYFQKPDPGLQAPRDLKVTQKELTVIATWHTAYAGDAPLDHYEVWCNNKKVAEVPYKPQTTKEPFQYTSKLRSKYFQDYVIKVVDKKNRVAETASVRL